mmetsp:Transcript_26918/g.30143  ORF Transcript_26918/g.30143 Transcript_26918/m.30143 type:complete len:600 (+) Transcript_26918:118-1917(+)
MEMKMNRLIISFAIHLKWLLLFLASSDLICCHRRSGCQALSLPSSTSTSSSSSGSTALTSSYSTVSLSSVGKSKLAILDGAEWDSVQSILRDQQKQQFSMTNYGYMKVVTGKDEDNRRIVAMECIADNNSPQTVYADSVAVIPPKVSDEDAISTYIASLSSIHCALPRIENIGGSIDSIILTGKVVVLGSGELACFSAEGLACMGMEVFMVNNKGNAKVKKSTGKLQVIKPAIGDSETGFSSHLGQFDSIVDTIGNERVSSSQYFDDDDGYSAISSTSLGESTLQMLKSRHQCDKYVSTLTHSQSIIASEGIFGGPRQVDGYIEKIGNPSFLSNGRECQKISPPRAIGNTLEVLMGKGVLFTEKQRRKACSKRSDAIRGWSLSDFWEQTSWPRDSSGSSTTRFGLPVRDDPDDDEFDDIFEDTYTNLEAPYEDDLDEVEEFDTSFSSSPSHSSNSKSRAIQKNPFVLNIMDIKGMESEIVSTEKNCIVFMSAKFCRTCKTIDPVFTRMARINQENNESSGNDISFVKAETSGASGKKLAKYVSVQAVPSFVFIREGQILGQASASKLPSRKIDKALQLLATGADWDYSLLDDNENELSK